MDDEKVMAKVAVALETWTQVVKQLRLFWPSYGLVACLPTYNSKEYDI